MYGESGKSLPALTPEAVEGYDLVMVTAAHSNIDYDMVQRHAQMVFDTKNAMKAVKNRENIEVL